MSLVIAALFLTIGFLGVLSPGFFYKSELLTPEQIERNKRRLNCGGWIIIALAVALLILTAIPD